MHNPNRVTLYREVNHRIRYYKLSLMLNLFGEYIFLKEYGSIKAKRATRTIVEYFKNYQEAQIAFEQTLFAKLKRGYSKIKEKNDDTVYRFRTH